MRICRYEDMKIRTGVKTIYSDMNISRYVAQDNVKADKYP